MKLTIYTADCTGVNDNCLYPHKVEATNAVISEQLPRQRHFYRSNGH